MRSQNRRISLLAVLHEGGTLHTVSCWCSFELPQEGLASSIPQNKMQGQSLAGTKVLYYLRSVFLTGHEMLGRDINTVSGAESLDGV